MAPPSTSAKLTLNYPIFTSDFDPQNCDFLIVGGGGGEGRSGIGNKITLIDTSKRHELGQILDLDLSRSEDSVTSLAVARSTRSAAIVLAGINSSSAAQSAGHNEHLRSFRLTYPPKRKRVETNGDGHNDNNGARAEKTVLATAGATALGKVGLFAAASRPGRDTYQRVLRLATSKPAAESRLAVMATGFAPAGEIVVFDAAGEMPGLPDVKRRIQLKEREEAADVDVVEIGAGGFLVAYCSEDGIFAVSSTSGEKKSKTAAPVSILAARALGSDRKGPSFRCLRFLTPTLLVALQNLPGRSGAELLLVEMPSPSALGTVIARKGLPASVKSGTAMATATLVHDLANESTQHVIAVGSRDISILTVDIPAKRTSSRLQFRSHSLLQNLHPNQITSLAFSNFISPPSGNGLPIQYLKLASTSMAATVVVQTFHLRAVKTSSMPLRFRYILRPSTRSPAAQMSFSLFVSVIVIAIGAFVAQAWLEIRGGKPEYLGAKDWLSEPMRQLVENTFGDGNVLPSSIPMVGNIRGRMVEGFEHPWMANDADDLKERPNDAKAALVDEIVIPLSIPKVEKIRNRVVETFEHPWEASNGEAKPGEHGERDDRLDERARAGNAREATTHSGAQKASHHAREAKAARQRANNAEMIRQAMAHVGQQNGKGAGTTKADLHDEQANGGRPADEAHIERLMAQLDNLIAQDKKEFERTTHAPESHDPEAYAADDAADHVSPHFDSSLEPHQVVVFRDTGDSVELEVHEDHGASAKQEAKQWKKLSHRERAAWRRKLAEAGHWSAEQGEQVLQGAFFGVIGGLVG